MRSGKEITLSRAQAGALGAAFVQLVVGANLFGVGNDKDLDVIALATTMIIGAMLTAAVLAVWMIFARLLRPIQELWDDGAAAGYAKGWAEGRKAGRPEVVRLGDPRRDA